MFNLKISSILIPIMLLLPSDLLAVGKVDYSEESLSRDKLQELSQTLKHEQKVIAETEKEKRRVLSHVYELKKKLKKAAHNRSRLSDQMIHFKANVEEIAEKVADLESLLNSQRSKLKKRLRVLYKLSGRGYLHILFSSNSSANLDRNLMMLKKITESDYKLVSEYQANVKQLENKREALKKQVRSLLTVKDKIQKQEDRLAKIHKERKSYIAKLERKRKTRLSKLEGLKTKTASLYGESAIEEIFQKPFFDKKGQLKKPIQGTLITGFGIEKDKELSTRLSHKGLFYGAMPSSAVVAVAPGEVKFSGSLRGSGGTVIVDHGQNYYTVYSNLSQIKIKKGQKLNSGEQLGLSGSGNGRFTAGLYFELRHFSEPLDPLPWIAKDVIKPIRASAEEDLATKEEI